MLDAAAELEPAKGSLVRDPRNLPQPIPGC